MLHLFICAFVLFSVTDVVLGKYTYQPEILGWIAQHKIVATWDEAYQQCRREGAVLASPNTLELHNEMQTLTNNTLYYTGIRARFVKNIFVSIEGVSLEDMPVSDLFEKLDPEDGQCVAMNSEIISLVPCTHRLPYMCYKKQNKDMTKTMKECDTYDEGYRYVKSTGSCYKVHFNLTRWGDAYSMCMAEGGYLAIVNNESEAKILVDDIITVKTHYILIGLIDWEGTDNWTSIHGEPIENLYHTWLSSVRPKTAVSCATIDPDTPTLKAFGDCLSTEFYFVCEKASSNHMVPVEDQDPDMEIA